MPEHTFFFAGLALLFAHELDAVRLHEWRLFPGLRRLDDEAGYRLFTALHVPLFFAIFLGLFGAGPGVRAGLIVALDVFFIVHVALHVLLRHVPHYRFSSLFSWALIAGAGVAGALDLALR